MSWAGMEKGQSRKGLHGTPAPRYGPGWIKLDVDAGLDDPTPSHNKLDWVSLHVVVVVFFL